MRRSLKISQIDSFLTAQLDGVFPKQAWGETSYFFNPGNRLPRGTYFATIKEKDGENDKGSNLNREGVWRLNIGIDRPNFETLFGQPPTRPAKGQILEGPWDFKALNTLTPHPVYGWMSWVCVLCPSEDSWPDLELLIRSAHGKARQAFEKRIRKIDG